MVAGPTDHQAVKVPVLAYYIRQPLPRYITFPNINESRHTLAQKHVDGTVHTFASSDMAYSTWRCLDKMQKLTWNLPSPERLGKVLRFQEMYSMQR